MTKKERFYATLNRQKVDRPAFWLGLPTEEALPNLYKHFKVDNFEGLKKAIDDDIWTVICPYNSPNSSLIEDPFKFSESIEYLGSSFERTLTLPGIFAETETIEEVEKYNWPNPEEFIDRKEIKKIMEKIPDEDYAVMGVLWAPHFQLAFEAFGMEEALIKMKTEPEIFKAVIDKIVEFYLKANKIFLEETKGKLDAILIGNDFGTQNGLLVSPEDLREFVFEGTKKLIDQAHSYGVKVIHHSCGAILNVIDDIIKCGADVVHPIQALAKGMEPKRLKEIFGDRVSFCGGLDAQYLLVNGTPNEIKEKANELLDIFPTGLILSPSHEAILPDVPPENVKALVDAIKQR